MLSVENLGIKRENWVLRDVNLDLSEGEIYGVIGKSGAGKTTLLKLIAGLLDASEGKVIFMGNVLVGPSVKLIPGYDDIQLVNQDFGLDLYHTVEENVREKVLSRTKEVQEELINQYLDLVELLPIKARKAHLLSGGEQQRLSIARALACEPKLLLLDEPFVHLDQRLRLKILRFLSQHNVEMGTAIILVSHDGLEMMGFANKIAYLDNLSIRRLCSSSEMYYCPMNKEEAELMGYINEVEVDGELILFRPNEYKIEEHSSYNVKFIESIDAGLLMYNYFVSMNGETIMLVSNRSMNEVESITINKKYELD